MAQKNFKIYFKIKNPIKILFRLGAHVFTHVEKKEDWKFTQKILIIDVPQM